MLLGDPAATGGELSAAAAAAPPCAGCEAPCCRFLPLETFGFATLLDLDYARWLLGFEGIELAVTPDGAWHAFYRRPCRFLDPVTAACTVHGSARQPHVCAAYDAHRCWYRGALGPEVGDGLLRVDRRRLEHVADGCTFDGDRRLVAVPAWDDLATAFADLPLAQVELPPDPSPPAPADPPAAPARGAEALVGFDDVTLQDPCDGCAAWCCSTLLFDYQRPDSAAGFDHVRFVLGFPGVEVVVGDDRWGLAVRTRCRHLEGTRCGLHGDPRRPLRCSSYDAWQCFYVPLFMTSQRLRITLADFDALVGAVRFTRDGAVAALPSVADLSTRVAAARAAAGPSPAPAPRDPAAADAAPSSVPATRRLLPLLRTAPRDPVR